MSDPPRLSDELDSELFSAMLADVRSEQPSQRSLESTLAAVGVTGSVAAGAALSSLTTTSATKTAVATASTKAAGATATASIGGSALSAAGGASIGKVLAVPATLTALKWTGIGVTSAALALGAWHVAARSDAPQLDVPPTVVPPTVVPPTVGASTPNSEGQRESRPPALPSKAANDTATVPSQAREESNDVASDPVPPLSMKSAAPRGAPKAAPKTEAPAAEAEAPSPTPSLAEATPNAAERAQPEATLALGREVSLLDKARNALSSGDATAALAAVRKYQSEFPRGTLALEALYLRMESYRHLNRSADARRIARRLLELAPHGAHAARARALLE